jgi:hypothetical protein
MKMKKLISVFTVACVAFSVVGCDKSTNDVTEKYSMPAGLEDCKVFSLRGEDGTILKVVRCPISTTSTTYSSGRTTSTTNVVDGVIEPNGQKHKNVQQ